MGRSLLLVPGVGGGTLSVTWATVQSASIQTMSRGKCMFFIQKVRIRDSSYGKSIPVPGGRKSRSDKPWAFCSPVSANSTGNVTPPTVTTA